MVANIAATAAAAQTNATKQLAGNFDTFLKLLTTQLQNQDPMSPMDSNQFTQQLVQFSQVEQQINTNDNLKSLISLGKSRSASDAVGYLGKSVTVTTGHGLLSGGQAQWSYALGGAASSTTFTVSDAGGKVVYTQAGELTTGQHIFDWNGTDNNGTQLPDGVYTLNVAAKAADGSAVDSAVASKGIVDEVNLTGSEPYLMIGSMAVPLSQVAAVDGL
ncbi:MAG: flagellar hook assembly protein FlgD [Proteobacteria bacterium]|nr:flagellar hook assembly protein FlgD [Pseudomonadota bacterium]